MPRTLAQPTLASSSLPSSRSSLRAVRVTGPTNMAFGLISLLRSLARAAPEAEERSPAAPGREIPSSSLLPSSLPASLRSSSEPLRRDPSLLRRDPEPLRDIERDDDAEALAPLLGEDSRGVEARESWDSLIVRTSFFVGVRFTFKKKLTGLRPKCGKTRRKARLKKKKMNKKEKKKKFNSMQMNQDGSAEIEFRMPDMAAVREAQHTEDRKALSVFSKSLAQTFFATEEDKAALVLQCAVRKWIAKRRVWELR